MSSESPLHCPDCQDEFNYEANLPRVLICCGNTMCAKCLTEILDTTKVCSSCRVAITNTVKEHPVNKSLLEMKDITEEACKESFLQKCRHELIRRKSDFQCVKPVLKSIQEAVDASIKLIESEQDLLETFTQSHYSLEEIFGKTLLNLDERYKSIRQQIPSNILLVGLVSHRPRDFASEIGYLHTIKAALLLRKSVFAVLMVKGIKKFSRLSLKNEYLCVHALDINHDLEEKYMTVCFKDLQDVLLRSCRARKVLGFLEVLYNTKNSAKTLLIKIMRLHSNLGSQFLRVCSGELGYSYKALSYTQTEDKFIKHLVKTGDLGWTMDEVDNYSLFFYYRVNYSVPLSVGQSYLYFEEGGAFDVFKCKTKDLVYESVVGPVVNFDGDEETILKDATYKKIHDCGIAYSIPPMK